MPTSPVLEGNGRNPRTIKLQHGGGGGVIRSEMKFGIKHYNLKLTTAPISLTASPLRTGWVSEVSDSGSAIKIRMCVGVLHFAPPP